MLGTILIVILILALLGALPNWNHSRSWGYPSQKVFSPAWCNRWKSWRSRSRGKILLFFKMERTIIYV